MNRGVNLTHQLLACRSPIQMNGDKMQAIAIEGSLEPRALLVYGGRLYECPVLFN